MTVTDFPGMDGIQASIPFRTEPPLLVFGAVRSTNALNLTGIPQMLQELTTITASMDDSMCFVRDATIVYIPRLAFLKEDGNTDKEAYISSIAVYMTNMGTTASILRGCLRIAASWDHIGLIIVFPSLLASVHANSIAGMEECRNDLVGAFVEILRESDSTRLQTAITDEVVRVVPRTRTIDIGVRLPKTKMGS